MKERLEAEGAATLSVDDVLITEELPRRTSRPPDYAAENRALVALSEELAADPRGVMQKITESVLQLCNADSAGVSVLEHEGGGEVFRWHAAAGAFAHNLRDTVPRSASPCDTVVTRNRILLFKDAGRFFPALRRIEPRVYETLLTPWEVNGRVLGAVWAIKHTPEGRFEAEDARLLASLARFAGIAYSFIERARHASEERLTALDLMKDAVVARQQAEQASAALCESEKKYRALFESMNVGCAVVEVLADERGRWNNFLFLDVNPAFVRQTGMENAVGRRATEILGTPDPHWAQTCGRVAETGEPIRFEESEAVLGRVFDLYAFRLHGQGSRRVAILFTDITERRRAEEALRESRALLQKAVSAETVGVLFLTLDGKIQDANEAFQRMSGYSLDELRGLDDWKRLTPPEFLGATERVARELAERGETAPYEKQMVRKDGSRWWGLFAPMVISGSGADAQCTEFIIDITESKRAREALSAVANVVPDLLWASDPDGTTTWHNKRWREYTGQTFQQAMGWGWLDAIHPDDRENSARRYREAVEQSKPLQQEHRIRRHDGVYRWFLVRAEPQRDELGSVLCMYGAATDIHEQRGVLGALRESEERLRRLNEGLEERVRERTGELAEANASLKDEVRDRATAEARIRQLLGQLVTVQEEERRRIARELHDTLGQQLAALRWSIDLLKSSAEKRSGVDEAAVRVQSIFDQLNSDVDFLAWELRPASLDQLGLDSALRSFVREWSEHFGVSADYHGPGADAARLRPEIETNLYRLLQEALQNVHKHAEADHVSVQFERRDHQVTLIIEDNGKGYDIEAEESDDTNKGMGLTNMRERAALIGGTMEIESTPGAGTTIYVRLSLA